LLSIANHSWDHLHPALPRVAHSQDARGDFTRVATDADADAEIMAAAEYLARRTTGRAGPYFAYPFGHTNDFLVGDYLPRRGPGIGVRAAVTTEPRPVRPGDSPFRLPRYVCGDHWRAPEQLADILALAARQGEA
jgi:peptidoglycan/xylan/chitin deacetylase (PgdA/CDA1 family)